MKALYRIDSDNEFVKQKLGLSHSGSNTPDNDEKTLAEKIIDEYDKLQNAEREYGSDAEAMYDHYMGIAAEHQIAGDFVNAAHYYKKAYEVSHSSPGNKAMAASFIAACYLPQNGVVLDADMISSVISYLDQIPTQNISFNEVIMCINFYSVVLCAHMTNKVLAQKIADILRVFYNGFSDPAYSEFIKNKNYHKQDIELYLAFLYKILENPPCCILFANKAIESHIKGKTSIFDKIRTIFTCNLIIGIANYYTHFNLLKAVFSSSIQFIKNLFSCILGG